MQAIQQVFESAPLTVLTIEGRQWFLAQEIGRILGYGADGSELSKLARREWKSDLSEGKELLVAEGDLLRDIKQVEQQGVSDTPSGATESKAQPIVGARARSLLLLSEEAVYIVCMKTNKPIGVRLRRWLAYEVLPKLRRQELVPVEKAGELVEHEDKRRQQMLENSEQRRQNRLIRIEERKQDLEEKKFADEQRRMDIKIQRNSEQALLILATELEKNAKNEDDRFAAFTTRVALTELLTGHDLSALIPGHGVWKSPTEIAKDCRRLPGAPKVPGVPDVTKEIIGAMVTLAGLIRGDGVMSRRRTKRAANYRKLVQVFEYSPEAQKLIKKELKKWRLKKREEEMDRQKRAK